MKKSLEVLTHILGLQEESIRLIGIMQSEEQRGNGMKKNEQNLREMWDTINYTNIHRMRTSGEKRKK